LVYWCIARNFVESMLDRLYHRHMASPQSFGRNAPFASIAQVAVRVYSERRKIATVAAGVLALALGYHVVFGQNGLIGYEQKRQDAKTLDGELNNLQRENEQLKGHVDRLQSDPNAIEHQAREELHYTRPGEVIYALPATPNTRKQPDAAKQ
jgi:cell division protein FtsB